SAVAADLTVTRERLFERIVRGGTGAYGELLEPLKNLGIAGLGGLLTDVERVVVRVRLDPKGGRADARIDWAPGGDSAARRGTEALHGAATMASSLALLPDDVHVAVTDGAADPKTLGLATARLRKALRLHGGAEGAASLDALLEGMAPGYVGAEAWSEGEGVLIEIYRSRDAAVTKAAVAALSGEGLVAEPLPEGKAASLGELRVSVLALEHHLVFVSGGEKSVAYAKALPAREGGTPTAFAKGLGALPLGAAIDLPKLYRLDEPSSPLYLGYRVTEKGPDVLRSGASFQGEQNGLWMAARVILLGRDPEPAPTAADGSVP
ncbi:MAG: hypothetical protein KC731_25065, partial [Myxococcales bacterium]|nr:hypothetical protein [Myxococcales bacterium]